MASDSQRGGPNVHYAQGVNPQAVDVGRSGVDFDASESSCRRHFGEEVKRCHGAFYGPVMQNRTIR